MRISLTSRAQLRYRGVVHSIDGNQGTMTLKDVISMGTEDRPAAQFIPPMVDRIHPIVVFTVNDILDLAVEPTTTQALPEDPAIRQSVSLVRDRASLFPSSDQSISMMKYFRGCKVPSGQRPRAQNHVDASVAFLLRLDFLNPSLINCQVEQ